MYFFTGNLSFLDLWYSSVYTPKILVTCISEDKSVSFTGCVVQFFFSVWLASSECCRQVAMAYDCYAAISSPLLYAQVMSRRLCICLVIYSHTGGVANAIILTSNTFTLNFCGCNVIDDFFCDVPPLVKLARDVQEKHWDVLCFLLASSIITPTMLILASYAFIIAAILRIHSTQGRLKAFSTCSSHVISVTCTMAPFSTSTVQVPAIPLRGTRWCLHLHRGVPHVEPHDLRNKDVKDALKKTLQGHTI